MVQFKIITIEFNKKEKAFDSDTIERLVGNKKIKEYKSELINVDGDYFWTIFVAYEEIKGVKIESKHKLTEAEEILLEKLKVWRSTVSKESGVPSYIVAKNEHLIQLVKRKPKTLQEMKLINGIGDKKVKDYGEKILEMINNFFEESQK